MRPIATAAAFGLALAAGLSAASAQSWPNGSIQLVIASRPGGGTDIMGRIFADYLQTATGVPVAVINQPGGGGSVAHEQVRQAAPDGQTLLFQHTTLLVNYHTGRYDHGWQDFTVLGIAQSYPPQVYAVGASSPWQTMREFVEDARANPGAYTVGVSLGGSSHFMAGALMMNEGVELRLVEAAAEVDKVAGVQGGHIHLGNLGAASARQFEQTGVMRVLCMTDPDPDPDYPEYRTCREEGIDMSFIAPLIVWGPPGMDPAISEEINTMIRAMGDDPQVQTRLAAADSSFRAYNFAESQEFVAAEDAFLGALASHLGLSVR